jgi:hypothetical protein
MLLAKRHFEVSRSLSVELDQFRKMGWRTECLVKNYTPAPKSLFFWRLR